MTRHDVTRQHAHQVLLAARERLAYIGWDQGGYVSYDGSGGPPVAYCLLGAVHGGHPAQLDPSPVKADAIRAALGLIEELIDSVCIAEWNDTPGRTVDEVIAVLDRAIDATEPPIGAGYDVPTLEIGQ